ncbi:MAG TPA: pyridoxal 5'-phosphate synthase glutaminase subunit PdxT [bacterium]|nr:pyridoxal 5'-phosphate synthase glutaminase subunit PdxT [bacterium]
MTMRIGVLAIQGDVVEHRVILRRLAVEEVEVRVPGDLDGVDGLILPGGESTTIGKLMVRYGLDRAIPERVERGMGVYGTCAGMILLARRAAGGEPALLRLMDITVTRNAYGRQVDSFEAPLEIPVLGPPPLRGVFIRAPVIDRVGAGVEVLARYGSRPVLVREGRLLVSSFHPELAPDDRVHRYFIETIRAAA